MSWSRCSDAVLAVLVCLAVVAMVATAATGGIAQAVDEPGGPSIEPSQQLNSSQVGSEVRVTYELTNLYEGVASEGWTLAGSTDLTETTWIIAQYRPGDQKAGDNVTVTGSNFTVSLRENVTRVVVQVRGTVPSVSNFSYDPAQQRTAATFARRVGNSETTLGTDTFRPYTADSQSARFAIENASAAIASAREAGAGVSGAEQTLGNAIDAFDAGNFGNAQDLAEQAEGAAESAKQSSEQTSTLLMVGAGVVVLLVVAGAVYWWRGRGESYDELG